MRADQVFGGGDLILMMMLDRVELLENVELRELSEEEVADDMESDSVVVEPDHNSE